MTDQPARESAPSRCDLCSLCAPGQPCDPECHVCHPRASAPAHSGQGTPVDSGSVLTCPTCGEPYTIGSDGPYHLTCAHDGDHEVCDPDDRHLP